MEIDFLAFLEEANYSRKAKKSILLFLTWLGVDKML